MLFENVAYAAEAVHFNISMVLLKSLPKQNNAIQSILISLMM